MAVEPIQKVIRDWEHNDITPEQAIGKNLLHTEGLYNGLGFANDRRQQLSDELKQVVQQLATLQTQYEYLAQEQAKMFKRIKGLEQNLTQLLQPLTNNDNQGA